MSVNYPISPCIADYAQSINQAKLVLPQKKRGRPCHFLIIRLPHRWFVWLRQLVVIKNNERASGQNLFNSYLRLV